LIQVFTVPPENHTGSRFLGRVRASASVGAIVSIAKIGLD
jgi:hypothetical protein